MKSSMNVSLVYDIVVFLITSHRGLDIDTLRSIVLIGDKSPPDLLYNELIEFIQSLEEMAYNDAAAICQALQDLHECRSRYEQSNRKDWVNRTRLFSLLQIVNNSARASNVRNSNLILQTIGCAMKLWKNIYGDDNKLEGKVSCSDFDENQTTDAFVKQEEETACLDAVHLIEMLFLRTDQQDNTLQ
ncbi:hypothetical protein BBJ29_003199 [Phytophthora kernoviae]|uniref:Uncharacterized protein n=1 Tax=Phytophthora kernoviae TaxID=325452 RepID=A0A3R7HM00_9STRA|nr:hypothetical protein BBJ29_003199 [Phytophthora kernoviae]